MDYDRLLNLTTDLGYQLMASGAEIYRVEESMHRVLNAYGLERPEVFAIPNCIIVSVTTPQGHPITRMRRIPGHGTDIELLERCNDLCRHLCSQVPPLEDAQSLVSALERGYPRYSSHQVLMGYGLAPAFFTLLFGGHFLDGLCAFVCGLAVGICLLYGGRFIGSNSFFRTVVCSTVGSLLSLLLVRLGFGYDVDTVTIGVLMVLVPGVALTNAMREIMAGDIISGLSRTADAILVASAIALGTLEVDRDGANFSGLCLALPLGLSGLRRLYTGLQHPRRRKADLRLRGRTGLAGVSAGGQQHRGRVPGCGGHRRLFGDHGPAAPLPGDRLSAGSTSPPGSGGRYLLRHELLRGGRYRPVPG